MESDLSTVLFECRITLDEPSGFGLVSYLVTL